MWCLFGRVEEPLDLWNELLEFVCFRMFDEAVAVFKLD